MKIFKLVVLPLLVVLVFGMTAALPAADQKGTVKVLINGQKLSLKAAPQMSAGRMMVPLRSTLEALGAKVTLDKKSGKIKAIKGQTTLDLRLGRRIAYKNGLAIALDVAPVLVRGEAMVPLRFVGEALEADVRWQAATQTIAINTGRKPVYRAYLTKVLPVVGSLANLKKIVAASGADNRNYLKKEVALSGRLENAAAGAAAPQAPVPQAKMKAADSMSTAANEAAPAADGSADYSQTNVQVAGVDEADVVKTDGQYLYQVNRERVVISKVNPPAEMRVVKILEFERLETSGFTPQEMFVDAKQLVVIGSSYTNDPASLKPNPEISSKMMIAPAHPGFRSRQTTKVLIYDISDKAAIKKVREVDLEGDYVSSRKIGTALYLVANKYLDYYYLQQEKETDKILPAYRDTAIGKNYQQIPYNQIRYFPETTATNYLLVAGLDLNRPQEKLQVASYLGAGNNIYASTDNLYVAVTHYQPAETPKPNSSGLPAPKRIARVGDAQTRVYQFALSQGEIAYTGQGEVPGTILNQFAMDEHGGYFRIATTRGEVWRQDEFTSKNNIYILNREMKMTGKLEDLAPGEKIYAVRFMGDKGYLVTFRTVDPLFVVDLKNPERPAVLGELKIPGYSDYLHPYDENHIIGFGKDAVEVAQKDANGREIGKMAYYLGMKMAIFDVSDVTKPKEMFTAKIGDRGTDSELLHNHKALLFSKEKNLLAFPVTLMEVNGQETMTRGDINMPQYGQFTYQGAFVYNVDLVNGFNLKGRITHLSDTDLQKAGDAWYNSDKNVNRILYIGDNLYTLSNSMIKANNLNDLQESGKLTIPEPKNQPLKEIKTLPEITPIR